jgi:thiol-disulfide isomerase/thioredoxin
MLVDCWATWCLPCVEQLPHSVALAKEHAADGLAVVTLDFDDPDAIEQVRKLLAGADAGATNVINLQCKLGPSPDSMTAFEITSGALPHYKLYDRAGKLVRTFEIDPAAERRYTPAHIESAVVELLAK